MYTVRSNKESAKRTVAMIIAAIALVFASSHTSAGEKSLKKIEFGSLGDDFRLYFEYDPELADLILKKENTPESVTVMKVARLSLRKGGEKYLLEYDYDGQEFTLQKDLPGVGELYGYRLGNGFTVILPGDGFLYLKGYGRSFDAHAIKFRETSKGVEQVDQPFGYLGLETRALLPLDLFLEREGKVPVAHVEKGEPLTLLLNYSGPTGDCYLLRVEPGIVGWWKPQKRNAFKAEELEGILNVSE